MTGALRRSGWTLAVLAAASLHCGGKKADSRADHEAGDEAQSDAKALTTTTDTGPVKATVSLTPTSPKVGDVLTLTLEVESDPKIRVELPPFGDALGRFTVLDFTPRETTGKDGKTVQTQTYSLQSPGSGRHRIPQMRIQFWPEGDADGKELLTDEVPVTIESVVAATDISGELSDLPGTLDESPGLPPWLLPAAGLSIIPIALLVLWFLRARRRAVERQLRLGAFDRAMGRMRALEGRGLPEPEHADAWYVELSSIVRRYLEERLQIRAPELTTEEFLASAGLHADLDDEVRSSLSRFLAECDRVKFAAYRPAQDESQAAFALASEILDVQEQALRRREAILAAAQRSSRPSKRRSKARREAA